MMVNTDGLFCRIEIFYRCPKTGSIPAVLHNAEVVDFIAFAGMAYPVRMMQKFKNIGYGLQIQIHFRPGKPGGDVIIGCQAGADAVPVRPHMSCNGNCFYLSQF